MLSHFSHVPLFSTLWTIACQDPLSMGFSRQEYWTGLLCPLLGDLPGPGIELESLMSPVLAGGFFTTSSTWEAPIWLDRCPYKKIRYHHAFSPHMYKERPHQDTVRKQLSESQEEISHQESTLPALWFWAYRIQNYESGVKATSLCINIRNTQILKNKRRKKNFIQKLTTMLGTSA